MLITYSAGFTEVMGFVTVKAFPPPLMSTSDRNSADANCSSSGEGGGEKRNVTLRPLNSLQVSITAKRWDDARSRM